MGGRRDRAYRRRVSCILCHYDWPFAFHLPFILILCKPYRCPCPEPQHGRWTVKVCVAQPQPSFNVIYPPSGWWRNKTEPNFRRRYVRAVLESAHRNCWVGTSHSIPCHAMPCHPIPSHLLPTCTMLSFPLSLPLPPWSPQMLLPRER